MTSGWTDTRNCEPLKDGEYIVQTVTGQVGTMLYTLEGGWNTSRKTDGTLSAENKIDSSYVARWFLVPMPDAVPAEWYEEWINR